MSKDVRIAGFDIGAKNFSYGVEYCSSSVIRALKKHYHSLPKKYQRRVKGTMNTYISKMLDTLFLDGQRVVIHDDEGNVIEPGMGVVNLRKNKDVDILDLETRINLFEFLKSKESLWDSCDIIVIEQQYFNTLGFKNRRSAGTGANVKAIKLGECCLVWFLERYWPFKTIIVFGAAYKTQTLGAPDKLTKPQRKRWAVAKGKEIMHRRGDDAAIEYASTRKLANGRKQKEDDMYDNVIMIQAFKLVKLVID